jgi:nucleotide-binding universal stress UspA family protein
MDAPEKTPPEPLGELRFNRLLVAVDGSPGSDLALAAAVTVARRDNAALTLLSVARDATSDVAGWSAAGVGAVPPTQEEDDAAASQTLREAVDRIPQDVSVRTVVRRGRAGPAIVSEAREGSYDAVLLGARGVGRVGALIGSVSQYVLHNAPVPVFVAHAPRDQP